MEFTLKRYRRGRLDGTELWKGYSFDFVKDEARRFVQTREADHVEIVDADGKMIFRWPRMLRRS